MANGKAGAPRGNQNALHNKGGRPTDYKPEYADLAFNLNLLYRDCTDAKLAEVLGVDRTTIVRWKDKHVEFRNAILKGKAPANAEVAKSLYESAKGYEHKAVKIYADPNTGKEKKVEYVERYPPNPQSARLFLMNREPEHWRDKVTVEIDDPKKVLSELLGISEEEIPE